MTPDVPIAPEMLGHRRARAAPTDMDWIGLRGSGGGRGPSAGVASGVRGDLESLHS